MDASAYDIRFSFTHSIQVVGLTLFLSITIIVFNGLVRTAFCTCTMSINIVARLIGFDIVRKVIVTYVGAWILVIRCTNMVVILTVTTAKRLVNLISRKDGEGSGRYRSGITAAIDRLNASLIATFDNYLCTCFILDGRFSRVGIRRIIQRQIAATIDSQHVIFLVSNGFNHVGEGCLLFIFCATAV